MQGRDQFPSVAADGELGYLQIIGDRITHIPSPRKASSVDNHFETFYITCGISYRD